LTTAMTGIASPSIVQSVRNGMKKPVPIPIAGELSNTSPIGLTSSLIARIVEAGMKNLAKIHSATGLSGSIVTGQIRQSFARPVVDGMKSHALPAVAIKSAITASGNTLPTSAKIARKKPKSDVILRRVLRNGLSPLLAGGIGVLTKEADSTAI